MYHPHDGFNRGVLACSTARRTIRFTWRQNHIAYRRWHRAGCGRRVVVCAKDTRRCVLSKVMDGGPYTIVKRMRGRLRQRVWVHRRPPAGWRWRAVADLSWALWVKLGKPRGFTRIRLYFMPKNWSGRGH